MRKFVAVPDEEAGQLGVPVAVTDGFFCLLPVYGRGAGARVRDGSFRFSPRSPAPVIKMSL
jgi:hypothetical protein